MEYQQLILSHMDQVRKTSHVICNKYGIREHYEDIESEGMVILVDTVRRFDPAKAKMSTYLYKRLLKLEEVGIHYREYESTMLHFPEEGYTSGQLSLLDTAMLEAMTIYADRMMESTINLEEARQLLSNPANMALDYIFSGQWEELPTKSTMWEALKQKLSRRCAFRAWDELMGWYYAHIA